MTKKIMRSFKIDELSAVDSPAQEGARMVIMKRAHTDDKKKKKKDGGSVFVSKLALLTEDATDGHSHLILGSGDMAGFTSFGGATDEDGHNHPWIKLADGTVVVGADHGHEHSIREGTMKTLILPEDLLEKALEGNGRGDWLLKFAKGGEAMADGSLPIRDGADLESIFTCPELWGDNPDAIRHIMKRAEILKVELPTDGDLATLFKSAHISKETETMTKENKTGDEGSVKKELDEALAKQATTEAELKVAKRLADMSDVQKAHYQGLDVEAAVEFIEKTSDEMDADLDAAADADMVVYKSTDGTDYRQSDDPRTVALAKKADANDKKIAKMEKAAENTAYAKRAKDELSHLPGTEDSKVATLKAIDTIEDEDVRKTSLEALHAQNTDMAKAFTEYGTGSNPVAKSAEDELNTMVAKYAKENEVTEAVAYSAVCKTEEGSALYDQSTEKTVH